MSHLRRVLERQNTLRSLALCALLCFCLLPGGQAQQAPDPQTTIRKQVNLVLVDVIVTDPKGTVVGGLRTKDFEILDEGTPQEVAHLSQDEIPLAIALVFDVSGSMQGDIQPIQNGLARALPTLKAEDRVALFSFADHPKFELGLTRDFTLIAKRIAEFGADGATNINDAIYDATDYLRKKAPQGRRVIILISDTWNDSTGLLFAPAKQVVRDLLQSEIALFGIRPGIFLQSSLRNPQFVDVDQLVANSGGFMVNVHSPDGYKAAFETLIRILKTRYTLGFYPNTAGKPGSVRHLTVRLKNTRVQEALPNVTLRYRRQYVVPREKTQKSC